ncbi:MAG: hypothetical protein RR400_01365 [Clostridia bacterium]
MKCYPPADIAFISTAIAVEISSCKTAEEILVIRNIASQVSAILQTIASQKLYNEKNCPQEECASKKKPSKG